jgi:TonB-linked SusC/RagA family outer membrane protein
MKKKVNCEQMKRKLILALLFLMNLSFLSAQSQIKISGTVVSQDNEPLIGVSIVEKGTGNGTVTDVEGKYSFSVNQGAMLVFSYIGHVAQEKRAVAGILNITMEEDAKALDEVVVIGYGVQKKSSVTGAISQVKAEDMQNRTITRPEQALQGKTAGVQIVQTSGAPGASPQVRVRGYSSNASSSPLFVVDGIRVSSIGGLDPNDISSIEVLKDAASAAIYGAEAGNGVILITTKRGEDGMSKISYDFQYTSQSLARIPKMLNSEEYIDYMVEGNTFNMVDLRANWDGVTNTSWADAAFKNAVMQRHNLSFSGGNSKGTYFLSLSSLNNDGIVKGCISNCRKFGACVLANEVKQSSYAVFLYWIASGFALAKTSKVFCIGCDNLKCTLVKGDKDLYKRLTSTVNADYQIKKWLKVGTSNQIEKYDVSSVSENNEYGSLLASVLQLDPLTPDVYAANNLPDFMQSILNNGHRLLQNENGDYYSVSRFFASEQYHPMIMRDQTTSTTGGFNVNGSIFGEITPLKGLVYTSRLGYLLSGTHNSSYNHPYYGNATHIVPYVGISATTSASVYYQWDNFINYIRNFGQHELTAMAGMSYSHSTSQYTSGNLQANGENAIQQDDPLFAFLNYAAASATKGTGGEVTEMAKLSYFGRIGYNYGNRYFLQASLRADAADLAYLAKSNRWGYFPAVSAGWDMARESFMEDMQTWLSQLKLRASWGQSGSLAALGGYAYSTNMTGAGIYPFVNDNIYTVGARPISMGNEKLKWETSEQLDFGLDARFLNNRLTLSADYFRKNTKDLIVRGATPSLIIGGTASPINAGDVMNKGVEFELGWQDKAGDFRYGIRANISTLSNEVTYLDKSLTRIGGTNFHTNTVTFFEQGYPVYYFRGYKLDRIAEKDIYDEVSGEVKHRAGDPLFQDLTPDGILNEDDKTNIGNAIPDLIYGITLTAAWKGLDLTIFGTGSQGNDIFNCITRADYPQGNKLKEVFYNGRWTPDNTTATVPRAGMNNQDFYMISDAMVFDGSFFKIKQIQIGYSLPALQFRQWAWIKARIRLLKKWFLVSILNFNFNKTE